jgi:hypothetical protein
MHTSSSVASEIVKPPKLTLDFTCHKRSALVETTESSNKMDRISSDRNFHADELTPRVSVKQLRSAWTETASFPDRR